MDEYVLNGIKLGWLIDPFEKKVHVYKPGQPVTLLLSPLKVSDETILPGFALELSDIWTE